MLTAGSITRRMAMFTAMFFGIASSAMAQYGHNPRAMPVHPMPMYRPMMPMPYAPPMHPAYRPPMAQPKPKPMTPNPNAKKSAVNQSKPAKPADPNKLGLNGGGKPPPSDHRGPNAKAPSNPSKTPSVPPARDAQRDDKDDKRHDHHDWDERHRHEMMRRLWVERMANPFRDEFVRPFDRQRRDRGHAFGGDPFKPFDDAWLAALFAELAIELKR